MTTGPVIDRKPEEWWVLRHSGGTIYSWSTNEAGAKHHLTLDAFEGCTMHHLREVDPAADASVAELVEAAREVVTRWPSSIRSVVGSLEWNLHTALIPFAPSPAPPVAVTEPTPPSAEPDRETAEAVDGWTDDDKEKCIRQVMDNLNAARKQAFAEIRAHERAVCESGYAADRAATDAIIAGKNKEIVRLTGPGSPAARFRILLDGLKELGWVHPNPTDSAKAPEAYALEWVRGLTATGAAGVEPGLLETARIVLASLVAKAPLLDVEGEHGPKFDKATLTQFRHDMAISAIDYAHALHATLAGPGGGR